MRRSVVLKTNRSVRVFQCSDDSAAAVAVVVAMAAVAEATIESVRTEAALLV